MLSCQEFLGWAFHFKNWCYVLDVFTMHRTPPPPHPSSFFKLNFNSMRQLWSDYIILYMVRFFPCLQIQILYLHNHAKQKHNWKKSNESMLKCRKRPKCRNELTMINKHQTTIWKRFKTTKFSSLMPKKCQRSDY